MPVSSALGRFAALALVLAAPAALAQAALAVRTAPAGAEVFVDGEPVGVAPVVAAVAPGARVVEARSGRLAPVRRTVTAVAGDTVAVVLRFGGGEGRVRVEGLGGDVRVETPGWALDGDGATLPPGPSTLRVVSAEGDVSEARFVVADGAVTTVTYERDRFQAQRVAIGLVLPGVVQLRGGRPVVGAAVAGGLLAAGGVAVVAQSRMADARSRFTSAENRYATAQSEAAVAAAIADLEAARADERSAAQLRRAVGLAAAAVYAASLADALAHHARGPGLTVSSPVPDAWSLRPSGAGLALRYTF